ncbi:hypothetical protein BTA49_09445 [Pseudomonas mosselii]|nr:hypothetical protein CLJ08_06970 [Pseudomonas mosselii]ORT70768.1 hypothetical protein BTA49_09445 [Pseudomonas mosselii]
MQSAVFRVGIEEGAQGIIEYLYYVRGKIEQLAECSMCLSQLRQSSLIRLRFGKAGEQGGQGKRSIGVGWDVHAMSGPMYGE